MRTGMTAAELRMIPPKGPLILFEESLTKKSIKVLRRAASRAMGIQVMRFIISELMAWVGSLGWLLV